MFPIKSSKHKYIAGITVDKSVQVKIFHLRISFRTPDEWDGTEHEIKSTNGFC